MTGYRIVCMISEQMFQMTLNWLRSEYSSISLKIMIIFVLENIIAFVFVVDNASPPRFKVNSSKIKIPLPGLAKPPDLRFIAAFVVFASINLKSSVDQCQQITPGENISCPANALLLWFGKQCRKDCF